MDYYVKQYGPHKFGCVLLPLPAAIAKIITDFSAQIPDDLIAEGGRETDAHITLKYGLKEDSPQTLGAVRGILAGFGFIPVRFGAMSLFRGGKDGDVLKLDIDSPILHRLNAEITAAVPCFDKFPEYHPHATVAYLDPAAAEQYVGSLVGLTGIKVNLEQAEYCTAVGERTMIKLGFFGGKAMSAIDVTAGGALVPPPQQGRKRIRPSRLGQSKTLLALGKGWHEVKAKGTCKPGQNPERDKCTAATDDPAAQRQSVGSQIKPAEKAEVAEVAEPAQKTGEDTTPPETIPPEQVDTSDAQFEKEWAATVEKALAEVEANDVTVFPFDAQQAAAEQDWHKQYIEWRWGLTTGPDGQSNKGKYKPTEMDVGAASRFVSGLLNPVLGGAAYVANLYERFIAPRAKTHKPADAAIGDELQAYFDQLNPGQNNKQTAEVALAVLGPEAAPVVKALAKVKPPEPTVPLTQEQLLAMTPAERSQAVAAERAARQRPDTQLRQAAAAGLTKPSKPNAAKRAIVAQRRGQAKEKKRQNEAPEQRTARIAKERAANIKRRQKQEARMAKYRAADQRAEAKEKKKAGKKSPAKTNSDLPTNKAGLLSYPDWKDSPEQQEKTKDQGEFDVLAGKATSPSIEYGNILQNRIDSGDKIVLHVDGKKVPIAKFQNGMAVDERGQQWGMAGLQSTEGFELVGAKKPGKKHLLFQSKTLSLLTKGRWVTMPANGEGGGGSPVYIDGDGEIEKGPAGTVGKKPDQLENKKPKEEAEKPAEKKPESEPEQYEQPESTPSQPKRIEGQKEIEKWGQETFGDWGGRLTEKQFEAIDTYMGSAYSQINDGLRRSKGEKSAPIVKELDAALQSAELPEPVVTYRGVKKGALADLQEGQEFQDFGFTSTSPSRHAGEQFASGALMEITVPKGYHAAYLNAIYEDPDDNDRAHEQELLLARGSKFKVTGVRREGGKKVISVEVVP